MSRAPRPRLRRRPLIHYGNEQGREAITSFLISEIVTQDIQPPLILKPSSKDSRARALHAAQRGMRERRLRIKLGLAPNGRKT